MRRDLVANASHELRTPIGAIRARLENVVDGVEEPTPALIAEMLVAGERLGALVEQLLDLSKLESGAMSLSRAEVEVTEILDAGGPTTSPSWRRPVGSRSSAQRSRSTSRSASTSCDSARYSSTSSSNAVRHSPAGGRVASRAAEVRVGPSSRSRRRARNPGGGDRPRLRAVLPSDRARADGTIGSRAFDRPVDRRAARRDDPHRPVVPVGVPHGGEPATMREATPGPPASPPRRVGATIERDDHEED